MLEWIAAASLTAVKRSAFKPEPPFTLFVKAYEAWPFVLNLPFILPDCGLPTEVGDALNHDVLNLESLSCDENRTKNRWKGRNSSTRLKKSSIFYQKPLERPAIAGEEKN